MEICPILLGESVEPLPHPSSASPPSHSSHYNPPNGYNYWNSIDLIHASTLHNVQIQLIANAQSYLGIESASRPIQRLDNNRSPRPARASVFSHRLA